MFLLDKLSYFLITRAKSVVAYLKKFTQPRYVIAFVIIYPHVYTNIASVLSAVQELLVNLADQFYSWIEAAFWGIYNYVKDKLQGIWFGDQIAYLVAGIAMAFPFLAYIIFKYAFTPVATSLLTVSLNVLGTVFYIFCRVVIPALKMAYGAYLFARFMPASYKYVAKALERFAQGKFGGFLGALFGAFAPFSMFFIGPLIISIVTDNACGYAVTPPTAAPPYLIPYAKPVLYQYVLDSTTSWIVGSIYGQYWLPPPVVTSFINAYALWSIRELASYSYIMPLTTFAAYPIYTYGPYYPGAYPSPTLALSAIYPSVLYSLISGYLPATYSYIFAEVPIFTATIFDASLLIGPANLYAYLQDLSYLIPTPGVNIKILDYSYLTLLPGINVPVQDLSYLVLSPGINVEILDLSYLVYRG